MSAVIQTEPIVSINLPTVLEVGRLEDAIKELFLAHHHRIEHLELNLANCYFIEVASLIRLISLLTQRSRQGLHTTLALPKDKDLRDFLRAWNFQDAVRKAVGRPFITLVRQRDHRYFGENPSFKEMKYAGIVKRGGLERLHSEKFFSIRTFQIELTQSKTMIVINESSRWEERLISSVLERYLKGPESYIASRVIYESLTNAVRHPNGTLIQTASHFAENRVRRSLQRGQNTSESDNIKIKATPGFLTIVVWDDGDSMVDTLRTAIDSGKSIRTKLQPKEYDRFWVKLESENQAAERINISSDFTPDKNTKDELVLLSTVFPGITRDPYGSDHSVHTELQDKPELILPGMGLSVLLNTVVDIFGGSVAFRTKQYLMNIKSPSKLMQKDGIKYRAKLYRYPETVPQFLGNMVTVRLPIKT